MNGVTCDLCGKTLLLDEDVRYVAKIEVYAAYDPLELTAEDLARDRRPDLAELVRSMQDLDPAEAEDSVYKRFDFDLCPACQKQYLKRPLPAQQ